MKITNHQLRNLIKETIFKDNQRARIESLRHFYRLSDKLRSIYDGHRSWDQAPMEEKLNNLIDIERAKLMSMINPETGRGFLETELDAIKNMNYDEFDLFMTYIDKD